MKNYLGVMLDCSRNAVMKAEELKKFILILKKLGYNCLQLYTEDTYEIEGEPQFGYRRGKYSKAELKEIDGNFITGGKPDPEHCGARYNCYLQIASANCM